MEDGQETNVRSLKVRGIFNQFDRNEDGHLNRNEMAQLVIAVNPRVKFSKEQIEAILDEVFRTYGEFVDGVSGLSFEGFLQTYEDGAGDVDRDFDALGLQLQSPVKKDVGEPRTMPAEPAVAEPGPPPPATPPIVEPAAPVSKPASSIANESTGKRISKISEWDSRIENGQETNVRSLKVRGIFNQFDRNEDGHLNRNEMAQLVIAVNPRVKFSKEQIEAILDEVFRTYGEFVDGVSGLSFEGFLQTYEDGAGDVDRDFDALGLQLQSPVKKDVGEPRTMPAEPAVAEPGPPPPATPPIVEPAAPVSKPASSIANESTGKRISKISEWDSRIENGQETNVRSSKLRGIFDHFDRNEDGHLNRNEMAHLVIAVNPRVKFSKEQIEAILDELHRTYGEFMDGVKGLSFDGLLRTYDDGAGDVNRDFDALGLQLQAPVTKEVRGPPSVLADPAGVEPRPPSPVNTTDCGTCCSCFKCLFCRSY